LGVFPNGTFYREMCTIPPSTRNTQTEDSRSRLPKTISPGTPCIDSGILPSTSGVDYREVYRKVALPSSASVSRGSPDLFVASNPTFRLHQTTNQYQGRFRWILQQAEIPRGPFNGLIISLGSSYHHWIRRKYESIPGATRSWRMLSRIHSRFGIPCHSHSSVTWYQSWDPTGRVRFSHLGMNFCGCIILSDRRRGRFRAILAPGFRRWRSQVLRLQATDARGRHIRHNATGPYPSPSPIIAQCSPCPCADLEPTRSRR